MDQRKQRIIDFILDHFDGDDFERNQNYGSEINFETYDELEAFQRSLVNGFNESSIATTELLIKLIPMINIMDKEGMIPWESSGFLFNSDHKIVIFHER